MLIWAELIKWLNYFPAFEKLFELYGDNVFVPIDKINTHGANIKNYSYVIIKRLFIHYFTPFVLE
ncbi:hypothetical protein JCM13304A_10720 [Desulfothermus okinawensis JCM 13304]